MSRKVEPRSKGKRIFRKTAVKTNIKNVPSLNIPRGGIRL